MAEFRSRKPPTIAHQDVVQQTHVANGDAIHCLSILETRAANGRRRAMARLPRFILPGYPQHVIQRGNNRATILHDEDDYWVLWTTLRDAAQKFRCSVHAYVLMPNHFHLLLTPEQAGGIGKLMQYTGRYYVQHANQRYGRTGTLWDGRYRATLLDPDDFLLPVSHYIERNPVRAGLVQEPAAYDWSSHGANALGIDDELVEPHAVYLALGATPQERCAAYAEASRAPADPAFLQRVRDATNKAWVLGDDVFCREVEGKLNRRTRPQPRGGDRRSDAFRRSQTERRASAGNGA
jgi:putative transposase